MNQLYRISAPHYVAGIEVGESGHVVTWAPILSWTAGKAISYLKAYFKRKGFKVELLNGQKCERCKQPNAYRRRQMTSYPDDESNFAVLCDLCQQEADEYWTERWEEYYRGCY